MVIALFALSLVMILGGIAAVTQGFPYVRLESGQVLVVGGATAASAGVVLLGIAVLLMEMKRLVGVVLQRGGAPMREPAVDAVTAPAIGAPSFEEAPPFASSPAAVTAGAAGLAGVALGAAKDLLAKRRPAIEPAPNRPAPIEPSLPDLSPTAVLSPVAPPASVDPISPDEDLFASPDDRPGHGPKSAADEPPSAKAEADPAQEELALRPALEEPASAPVSEPTAEPAAATLEHETPEEKSSAAEAEKPKSEELQVVGTYSSGANTYVMFANGTIQADTPQGQFTFQSLDELKAFVDSGGESSARGAA